MADALQVANVDRSLRMLETLAGAPAGLSLGALAGQLGMPKSATHRLLRTLAANGYVVQDARSQDYCLSLKLALLGFRFLDARRLPELLQQVLDRLAQASAEYCRIAMVEGERLWWIARAQGAPPGLRYDPPMGGSVVLHATATGKAWLATLPERQALRIAAAQGFATPPGFGRRAVKTRGALARELGETRRRGYAVAVEEGEPGIVALARAFRSGDDEAAAGTVSIAGPITRLHSERVEALAPLLAQAASEIAALWPLSSHEVAT